MESSTEAFDEGLEVEAENEDDEEWNGSDLKFINLEANRIIEFEHLTNILTLLIPSYFGPTLYTKGGGGGGRGGKGHLDPPTISSTLDCTNLRFCKVLDIIPFQVSENTRSVKNLLYGYHANCLITWCFSLIIVKTSMRNRYFSNAPKTTNLKVLKIKLCAMIVLFMYFSNK